MKGQRMALDTEFGAFLPTTDVFDRSAIQALDVNSPEFKDFLVRLYQTTNNIANAVNIRDAGYYPLTEFINGQLWFEDPTLNSGSTQTPEYRQVWRKVFNMGALPSAAGSPTTANHGIAIDTNTTFTRIYGTATNTTAPGFGAIPIPYVHATAANTLRLDITATQIIITSGGANYSAYDTCYVVLEYIKQ